MGEAVRVCALPGCTGAVTGPGVYCSPPHQAAAVKLGLRVYRLNPSGLHTVAVRVTPETREAMDTAAESVNQTRSAWLRMLITEALATHAEE